MLETVEHSTSSEFIYHNDSFSVYIYFKEHAILIYFRTII